MIAIDSWSKWASVTNQYLASVCLGGCAIGSRPWKSFVCSDTTHMPHPPTRLLNDPANDDNMRVMTIVMMMVMIMTMIMMIMMTTIWWWWDEDESLFIVGSFSLWGLPCVYLQFHFKVGTQLGRRCTWTAFHLIHMRWGSTWRSSWRST